MGATADLATLQAAISSNDRTTAIARGVDLDAVCAVAAVQITDLKRTLAQAKAQATDAGTKTAVDTVVANL